ncbi:MAG: YfcE family phosphodiesterase [Bullifex sp.]
MEGPVFVISDIHSDGEALSFAIERAEELNSSLLLIAGDLVPSGPHFAFLLQSAPFPYVCVRGNSDSVRDFRDLSMAPPPAFTLREIFGRSAVMTHGHLFDDYPVPLKKGDIMITGHTHVPALYEDADGVINLNPGSLSRPRGPEGPTYAVIFPDRIDLFTVGGRRTDTFDLSHCPVIS